MGEGSRRSSLLRDLASTSVVQFLAVTMNALSLAVIARRLGDTELGMYALERRAMSLLQPIALLGLSVAVPRYLAGTVRERGAERNAIALAGLTVVLLVSAVAAAVMLLVPSLVAAVAFGDAKALALARALAAFVFATAAYQIVYSIFRGWVMVGWANALELLAIGVMPLALALAGPGTIDRLIWALSGGILLVAVLFAAVGLHGKLRSQRRAVRARIPVLLRFGLARTPGDLAVIGLFSIGPLVVVHTANTVQAGYASIVLSSLNLVSVAAVPLSNLLLARVAADHAVGQAQGSPKYRLLWSAISDAAIGLAGLLIVTSPLVITLWLGDAPARLVVAQQVAALGVPGYIVYLVFRSYLDGTRDRPYSSIATIAGLGVLAASLIAGLVLGLEPLMASSVATALALSCAGVLIWRITARDLAPRPERSTVVLLVWLVAAMAAAALAGSAMLAAVVITVVAAGSYVVILSTTRPEWWITVLSRLPSRRTSRR